MEQMSISDVRKIVHAELEAAGIHVPVELKFDYSFISGAENVAKTKRFIKLCDGDYRNSIYVQKLGERYGDEDYFDLLFVVDEKGRPICIPVPLARKLFGCEIKSTWMGQLSRGQYEYIYKAYYENKNDNDLPF